MSDLNQKTRKALLEIVFLLLIIVSVFSAYGLAEKPFELSFIIEQADIKSFFKKDSSKILKAVKSNIIAKNEEEEEKAENTKVDSSSKFLLFCGDSMTEQMRFAWEEYAKKSGHKIITCTWYSSTTELWSKTDRLASLIKEYKPDIIWFTVGANELFVRDIEKRESYIKDIITEADTANIPFIWIGPPNWKDDSGINAAIEKHLGKKRFYYSGHFRQRLSRSKDGAHPTRASAALWADSIAVWFKNESAYKKSLILNSPTDTVETRPYIADKNICAPARDAKFKVRILQAVHNPILCENEILENLKMNSDTVKIILRDTIPSIKIVPQDSLSSQKTDSIKISADSLKMYR